MAIKADRDHCAHSSSMRPLGSCCAVASVAWVPPAVPLRRGILPDPGRRHHGEFSQPGQAEPTNRSRTGPGSPSEPSAPPELGAGARGAHRLSREHPRRLPASGAEGMGTPGVAAGGRALGVPRAAPRRAFPSSGGGRAAETRGFPGSGGPCGGGRLRAVVWGVQGSSPRPCSPAVQPASLAVTGERGKEGGTGAGWAVMERICPLLVAWVATQRPPLFSGEYPRIDWTPS